MHNDSIVAIIIPAYKERGNLEKLVPLIFADLSNVFIVIIDDNSRDGTKEIITGFKRDFNLQLIVRKNKRGRGSAVLDGFKAALKNPQIKTFIEMDADLSHNPEELKDIINISKENTVILASRYTKGSKIINWPISRKIASFFANLLIRLILKLPMKDNTNGYRSYPKSAVNLLINHHYISSGYMALSESAYLLYTNGFQFIELPSIFCNRKKGKSKTNLISFLISLIDLLRIRLSFAHS